MKFDSYIISNPRTALSVPLTQEILSTKKTLKQKAFTLAETLITLSIIGVVAAMTVPTLMSNMNKQIYVTGLKKAYNQLQNAIKMIPISEGCSAGDYECAFFDPGNTGLLLVTGEQLKAQYKVAVNTDKCTITKNTDHGFNTCFQTEDGMKIQYHSFAASSLGIDINGDKGPNLLGRDIFIFNVSSGESGHPVGIVLPLGSKLAHQYNPYTYWKGACTTDAVKKQDYKAETCAGRVLEENAMNY